MKTLLITKFFPPVRGGIEAMTYELAEGLNRAGMQADVLCANTGRRTIYERSASGYAITRTGSMGMLLSTSMSPPMVLELRRICSRYDAIHVELPDPMASIALWVARPAAPVVLRWHSDIVAQTRALKVYEPLQRWLLERADAITATSQLYADASPWLAPVRNKLHIIPLGIQDSRRDAVAAADCRIRHAKRRLVFSLGRMTYYKGFDTLISAAQHLPEDALVLIGGAGELLDVHRAQIERLGLQNRVQCLGALSNAEAAAYMQACDVFCLPSNARSEAFGVVLLEAMAAGRPIVNTAIGGSGVIWVSPNQICGITVPVNDAPALAQAIAHILDDPAEAAVFGAAARQRYLDYFTADKMVQSTADLLRSLGAGKCSGQAASDQRSDTRTC